MWKRKTGSTCVNSPLRRLSSVFIFRIYLHRMPCPVSNWCVIASCTRYDLPCAVDMFSRLSRRSVAAFHITIGLDSIRHCKLLEKKNLLAGNPTRSNGITDLLPGVKLSVTVMNCALSSSHNVLWD